MFVGDYAQADEYFNSCVLKKLRQFRYLASGRDIEIVYDDRALFEMDAKGGAHALINHFFSREDLYED